ncbi:MAG: DNA translocase FtsK 4TM domain-containing protein [Pseudomonadota bacterium]
MRAGGAAMVLLALWIGVALATFSISDPSWNTATARGVSNAAGPGGAVVADLLLQMLGGAAWFVIPPLMIWGAAATLRGAPERTPRTAWLRFFLAPTAFVFLAAVAAAAPLSATWPFATGMGGFVGAGALGAAEGFLSFFGPAGARVIAAGLFAALGIGAFGVACGLTGARLMLAWWAVEEIAEIAMDGFERVRAHVAPALGMSDEAVRDKKPVRRAPSIVGSDADAEAPPEMDGADEDEPILAAPERKRNIIRKKNKSKQGAREAREREPVLPVFSAADYELPPLALLAKPQQTTRRVISDEALEQNARMLENVLSDFGVRGEIINVRPGPVVTLYELEPAAGVKSSRVIGLADDIARSMSAIACRVAVVPGRNVLGIELPNQDREMVYLRELLGADEYENSRADITLALGKGIGGDPVFADLARMPHLLIAGTTGSGKSVGINTMILSLLYRLSPDQCKLILVDPKMLELSVYEGIPHLLAPVVTDPRKAVVALKWTVREMEERYRRMSKVGVRNIEGFNTRVMEAEQNGEILSRTVHTGYDQESGEPVYETEELEYEPMPFIVVVIDEVADLMMVAGKDIEGMVQRLAQMARAAGIHLIMATQRPSVDVITGTIKANFPTRISFQVTSKIDSRTILGEQGAEQLLGQGDMLHMAGGGRLRRVHGAFVSDDEVEKIVKHLKKQGAPDYVQEVTEMREEDEGTGGLDIGGNTSSGDALYDRAVAVVLRDRKASTSYVQRRLQIGYNRAATLIERMEEEGVISPANHAGKREILVGEDAA